MNTLISPHHSTIVLPGRTPREVAALVAELTAWNTAHGAARPCLWRVVAEQDDGTAWGRPAPTRWLDVGLAGQRGALRWTGPEGVRVPVDTTASTKTGGDAVTRYASDHSGQPCGVSDLLAAPLPVVWTALQDLLADRERPRLPAPWAWAPAPRGHMLLTP
ncbi:MULTISPECIES: Imm1 family immunity protein [Actinosynnema]|uniref:Imm1 family immunity protein n=1 Tax=Actinosynnema TaxID=40566 RepID=UPI0020A41B3D|nr:Imm1 family immunity protein [Actinosynnema pretiosum]MCP2099931.1 hypothetical protein [Actinosynnema pretiosum]